MEKQPLLAVVTGRTAGLSAGLTGADLARLTMVSFVMGNPLLSIVAARAMAKKPQVSPVIVLPPPPVATVPPPPPAGSGTAGDIKAAAAAVQLAKTQAETARQNAENAAKRAEDAAVRAENAAPPASTK